MGRIRAGLKFNIGKHGRIYIPLGGGSKKKRKAPLDAQPVARSRSPEPTRAEAPTTPAEPSVGAAIIFGLMTLLLPAALFLIAVVFGAFLDGSYVGGAICAVLALFFVFIGGLGLISLIREVQDLKGRGTREASPEPIPESPARTMTPPGLAYRYSYDRVGLYRPAGVAPMPPIGAVLLLEKDEDNPYDPDAIRAVQWTANGMQVYGYMNKGKLRDMVSDFIERRELISTMVTRADDRLELWIGMG